MTLIGTGIDLPSAKEEVRIHMLLQHPNIVRLLDSDASQTSVRMVMELGQQDLRKYLADRPEGLSLQQVRATFTQVVSAVKYCHNLGVLHRDIKPENILVDPKRHGAPRLRLADFGIACQVPGLQIGTLPTRLPDHPPSMTSGSAATAAPPRLLTRKVISLWYRPPELMEGRGRRVSYGAEVDMWSVGCVFFELAMGTTLLRGRDEAQMMCMIREMLVNKVCGGVQTKQMVWNL